MAAPCPVHYCGAPYAVDFGEQQSTPGGLPGRGPGTPVAVTDVPITSGRPLRTVRGTVAELTALADTFGPAYTAGLGPGPGRAARRGDRGPAERAEVRIPGVRGGGGSAVGARGYPRGPAELFREYLGTRGVDDARVEPSGCTSRRSGAADAGAVGDERVRLVPGAT